MLVSRRRADEAFKCGTTVANQPLAHSAKVRSLRAFVWSRRPTFCRNSVGKRSASFLSAVLRDRRYCLLARFTKP